MPRRFQVLTFLLIVLALPGCASRSQLATTPPQASTVKAEIKLTSVAFNDGQPIPRAYTCDGVNISPPLEWSGVPKTAKDPGDRLRRPGRAGRNVGALGDLQFAGRQHRTG